MKCIECARCDKEKLMCYPKSLDCAKEYKLTENDLYTDRSCDFARPIGEPIINYYGFANAKASPIATELNVTDFENEEEFIKAYIKNGGLIDFDPFPIYELTKEEYDEYINKWRKND